MLLTLALPQMLVAAGHEGGTFRAEKPTTWPSHPPVWLTFHGAQWCSFAACAQAERLCWFASGMLTCCALRQAIAWTVPELGGVP